MGDRVMLKRAGEVIPYIIGPVPDARDGTQMPYTPPKVCPSCGEPVVNPPGEVAYYCVNSACPAQLGCATWNTLSLGARWISLAWAINIGQQLVDAGLLHDLSDLYHLTKTNFSSWKALGRKKRIISWMPLRLPKRSPSLA